MNRLIILIGLILLSCLLLLKRIKEHFDASTTASSREQYLEDMVKYLTIIVTINSAQKELYKLDNGFAQTFSSPRLDALEKQRIFYIDKIKKNPDELAFFRTNLSVLL